MNEAEWGPWGALHKKMKENGGPMGRPMPESFLLPRSEHDWVAMLSKMEECGFTKQSDGASKAGQVSQPVRACKPGLGDLS